MTPTRKPAPIKCVAPWAGGKRTLAPRIVELLGEHDTYVEPFVGGCAILPAKPRAAVEIINDANPAVVNVLRAMRDHGRRLFSRRTGTRRPVRGSQGGEEGDPHQRTGGPVGRGTRREREHGFPRPEVPEEHPHRGRGNRVVNENLQAERFYKKNGFTL